MSKQQKQTIDRKALIIELTDYEYRAMEKVRDYWCKNEKHRHKRGEKANCFSLEYVVATLALHAANNEAAKMWQ